MRFALLGSLVLIVNLGACGSSSNELFENAGGSAGQDGGAGTGGSPCQKECTEGDARCDQDRVQRCTTDNLGCSTWGAPEACPTDKPYCSAGACAASCVDECSASGARACAEPGYRTCGQFDSDSCLDWSTPMPCGTGEVCRVSDATCVLDCGGGSCPCNAGETKACDDVGECKGGVRNCVNGEFGTCQWQKGPANEQCDAKDNDCDGVTDNHLVAQPCDKQAGVCLGSVKTCGSGQWLACSDADYTTYASAHGGAYESLESKCDGKDNDCNGKVDEVSTCCQPNCTGKVCGADNGCGYPCQDGACGGAQEVCNAGKCVCQPDCAGKTCGAPDGCNKSCNTGTCGANASCKQGTCVCDNLSCASACCTTGQVCASGTCCTPQCGTATCGPDPVCGQSCGTCPQPGGGLEATCSQGQCVVGCKSGTSLCKGQCASGACTWNAVQVADSSLSADNVSLDVDPAGTAHVSFVTGTSLFYAEAFPTAAATSVQGYPGCETTYNRHPSAVSAVLPKVYTACEASGGYPSGTYVRVFTRDGGTWTHVNAATLDSIYEVNDMAFLGDRLAYSTWHTEYNTPGFQQLYSTTAGDSWTPDYITTSKQNAKRISLLLSSGGKPSIAWPNWGNYPSSSLDLEVLNGYTWTDTVLSGAPTGNDVMVAASPSGQLAAADSSTSGLAYYSQASGWTKEVVDASIQWAPVEMVIDANGIPHIAYPTPSGVKLASKVGAGWTLETVSTLVANAVAVRLGPNGKVIVAAAKEGTGGGVWVYN
ncbi:MAG: hypothetical protein HY898_37080 [Deltaproteobacteria bacterium]|nr:hypothetical protein [Deltaproteobacteria bacterium]